MLFITAGMGGGTGTGAAPVIARAAKEREILTVGVVTKPFHFEGARRMRIAAAGIEALQDHVDTLLIIPNQNLFSIADERTTFQQAFELADQVLHSGVRGITDLMVMPGLINLDFNDVRTVMSEMGKAMMGTGEAEGDKRAIQAAEAAISNPLLDEVSMKGAKGVLINITGSMDMTLFEVDEAANRIRAEVDPEANIIVGSTFNQDLEGRVRVSVVATGIEAEKREAPTFQSRSSMSVSVARPWREAASEASKPAASATAPSAPSAAAPSAAVSTASPVEAPAAPASMAAPMSAPAPAVQAPAEQLVEPRHEPAPEEKNAAPAPAASNPVGDVHERIRRMLTEGPAAAAARNPFRDGREAASAADAAGPARAGFGAALGVFKSIGEGAATPDAQARPTEPTVREPTAGDLFDEDDADLEIPSFLRKKKVG